MSDRFGLLYDETFSHDLLGRHAELDFLEIIPDRFSAIDDFTLIPEFLTCIPTVFHSLNLSIGSDEALDGSYLKRISKLAKKFKPMWTSDHLAVTQIDGLHLGNLSPVRYSTGAIARIGDKIAAIQDELRIQFLIENIAYYFRIPGADMSECELLQELVEETGCGVLLDLNNVVVNSVNHDFDPYTYLREFPLNAVREIHIAGHHKAGTICIDSHGEPVGALVWDLLQFVSRKLEHVNVILERDQDIPPLGELLRELDMARKCVSYARM
ncbi:MAG: DUF692 domain-containing protein [Candidatus Korobacteraceae bacterium]